MMKSTIQPLRPFQPTNAIQFLLFPRRFSNQLQLRILTSPLLKTHRSSNSPKHTQSDRSIFQQQLSRHHYSTTSPNMSLFSNTNTGSKTADPYKEKNADETSIEEKITDLSEFVSACKFGMMTTRDGKTGALVSRCMALAAKVGLPLSPFPYASHCN